MNWNTFWYGGSDLTLLEIFFRATLLYFSILMITRLIGHRHVGIISAFNFITHAGIAHIATSRMVNPKSSLVAAFIILAVFYLLITFLSLIDYKFPSLVGTTPTRLIENGQLLHKNLKKAHITLDNLLAMLRIKDVHSLSDVAEAVFEPMGELSIVKNGKASPLTRKHLKLPSKHAGTSIILIYEGKIEHKHLSALGLEQNWLEQEIYKKGYAIPQIMLATLESSGNIYVSVNEYE